MITCRPAGQGQLIISVNGQDYFIAELLAQKMAEDLMLAHLRGDAVWNWLQPIGDDSDRYLEILIPFERMQTAANQIKRALGELTAARGIVA